MQDDPTILLAPQSTQAEREVRRNSPIRRARTCYDHLAGVAGVTLLGELLDQGYLGVDLNERVDQRSTYLITPKGEAALTALGVSVSDTLQSKRPFAYACLDWTERRPHLRGSLAAAILETLTKSNIVRRNRNSRVVEVMRPLHNWLVGQPV